MAIAGTHRGPISGLTHIHLVRESPAVRSRRSADHEKVAATGAGEMDPSIASQPAAAGELRSTSARPAVSPRMTGW